MMERKKEPIERKTKAQNPYTAIGFSVLINRVYTDTNKWCCKCTHHNGNCTDFAKDGTCRLVCMLGESIQDIYELAAYDDHWLVLKSDIVQALRSFWNGSVKEFLEECQNNPNLIVTLSVSAGFKYLWRWQDPWEGDVSFREMLVAGEGYKRLSIGKRRDRFH